MSPIALAILSTTLTVCCGVFFSLERRRARRFFPRVRAELDRRLVRAHQTFEKKIPHFNRAFMRQLFHYVVHRVLSRILSVIKRLEGGMRRVVQLNRKKAAERMVDAPVTHLQTLAEHKEETALSPREKEAHKEAALRGENPSSKPKKRVARGGE